METQAARPLRVNVVLKDRGWILDKMCRRLVEHLPAWGVDARISDCFSSEADVNHWFFTDVEIGGRLGGYHTLFVTHVDRYVKVLLVKRHLQAAQLGICMSRMTLQQLVVEGVPESKLCFINPAHDGLVGRRRIVIGITSRVRQDKAKREDLLLQLAAAMRLDAFHFDIIGRGWDAIIPYLEASGATVRYVPGTEDADADYLVNLASIPGFDYYLYLGLDEGSMGFIDAVAAGVPTIVTAQGFHLDANGAITHPFVTFDELHAIFRRLAAGQQQLIDSVAGWTWEEYARLHAMVWRGVVSGEDGVAISQRVQEGKQYTTDVRKLPIPLGWSDASGCINPEAIRGDVSLVAQAYTYGTPMFGLVQALRTGFKAARFVLRKSIASRVAVGKRRKL